MGSVLDFGVKVVIALQSLGSWPKLPMEFFSFLGTEDFFMVILPIIYWCYDSSLGLRMAVILMLSTGVNDALKLAFHAPRPYWISQQVQGLASETSFGLPSNHTQSATVIWGMLAAYLRKGWVWVGAAALVLLIGLSRIYLGVHFPTDVLLGLLVGALILWGVVAYWERAAAWAKKLSLGRQILAAFLASLVLILLPVIPFFWLKAAGWQPPQAWASFAGQATSLQGTMTEAGTLFGLWAGLAWLERQGGFKIKGEWWQLLLRFVLGIAGVLIIRYGLKFILPDGDTVIAYACRYLRYSLIGFWVSGGACWCFIRLKLAQKAA